MRESVYQATVIRELHFQYDRPLILKNDSGLVQGIPDLTIFVGQRWAFLEVKAYEDAPQQPNQEYYINWANEQGAFGAFIFPENQEEVFHALSRSLRA